MKPVFFILLTCYFFLCIENVRGDEENEFVESEAYINLTVPELVRSFGYPIEEYFIETPDGYILGIHRIPRGKTGKSNGKVVLLNHGLLCTSSIWVWISPNYGLGYLMADEGYDVWMINHRGNQYSRNHTKLNPDKDEKFWDFSWNEMGRIDLPTTIDFILEKTKVEKIFHVGHSQGTTVMYVMGATRPEYNNKIIAHASMAPIAFMTHLVSPLPNIASIFTNTIDTLLSIIGKDELFPNNGLNKILANLICREGTISSHLCTNILYILFGFNPSETDPSFAPYLYSYFLTASSTKQVAHYGQGMQSGHFRNFDHGYMGNIFNYLSITPPDYDLKKITANIYLYYSNNDWLSAAIDVDYLCNNLPNCKEKNLIKNYNHLDYMSGKNAPKRVYEKIIKLFATL